MLTAATPISQTPRIGFVPDRVRSTFTLATFRLRSLKVPVAMTAMKGTFYALCSPNVAIAAAVTILLNVPGFLEAAMLAPRPVLVPTRRCVMVALVVLMLVFQTHCSSLQLIATRLVVAKSAQACVKT